MVKEVNFEDVKRDVIHAFTNGCMCSESVITIANKHWDLGMGDDIMAIATGFPFGFGDGGNVRELNDDVIAKVGSALCPDLLEGYEFATPVRKEHCTEIVVAVLESFARIMERECGVHVCW